MNKSTILRSRTPTTSSLMEFWHITHILATTSASGRQILHTRWMLMEVCELEQQQALEVKNIVGQEVKTSSAFLQTNGSGQLVWTLGVGATSVPFAGITSGTNTTAIMTVGSGAALGYTGTGTINASSLQGATWASPLAIGSGTAAGGTFTTLSSNSTVIFSGLSAGVDNTILVLSGSTVTTDEIDSKVWDLNLVDGTGTSNYISKWVDSNTLGNSQVFDNSTFVGVGGTAVNTNPHIYVKASDGSVGIGTTNPTYKLDINGSLRVGTTTSLGGQEYSWPGSQNFKCIFTN